MPHRNQVSWNAMLTVLLDLNKLDEARELFDKMPQRNSTSYSKMITGLSRLGFVSEAREVFDSISILDQNVISWTAMISSYTHNNQPMNALQLFSSSYGEFFPSSLPNSYTFSTLMKACLDVESLVMAMQIHGLIIKLLDEQGKENVFVQNSLIDLHSKLGNLVDAQRVFNGLKWKDLSTWNVMMSSYARSLLIDKACEIFDSMDEKDALSWNIMISGFAECGRGVEALEFFLQLCRLREPRTEPNSSTYTIVLTVCATFTMLKFGTQIHSFTLKRGLLESNIYTGNSLINMYMKCGSVEESERTFYEMPRKDVVSWNSLVLGLGQNGYSKKALEIGEKALNLGIYNHNTFIALLTTCSHGGLVDEGIECFNSMSRNYGIKPCLDHYICVIDMLGRAGRITEAHNLLLSMPFAPNAITWAALLSACLVHGNEEIGETASRELRILEPSNAASYVMLANLYRKKGQFEESKQILRLMNKIDLRKEKGCSWIL
ncbi:Pentatricopeptide repeat [Macleaya cordata]|uniref:Pentatricopeptide repeat n=1 Tax=Macleaya cordata TaxID=56857 RepID=A0A200PT74_MACCD|nr:Pentatricopeptide repeat [Macleaya cordata]